MSDLAATSPGTDRDPEIREVGVAFVVEQDVGRVDVTVYDAGAMRRLEGVPELIDQRHGLRGRERTGSRAGPDFRPASVA